MHKLISCVQVLLLSQMLDLARVVQLLPSCWTTWAALALRADSLIAQAMALGTITADTLKMLESDALCPPQVSKGCRAHAYSLLMERVASNYYHLVRISSPLQWNLTIPDILPFKVCPLLKHLFSI